MAVKFLGGVRPFQTRVEMHFTIRQGLDLKIDGPPRQAIERGPEVATVALCGADFPKMRPKFHVETGQMVKQGETLFVDRHRPDIAFTTPVAGVVDRIDRSARGSFDYVVIRREGEVGARSFDLSADVRDVLLTSGLWPSLTARPFGRIPDPDAMAEAILVTAMDSNPLAADPAVVVSEAQQEFQQGLQVLTRLTQGQVFVCQTNGDPLFPAEQERIHCVRFSGRHPAGLPGTHLDMLGLANCPVWHIGYQAVIAIGRLYQNGRLSSERVVSVAGPDAKNPRLVRTVPGANLSALTAGETRGDRSRAVSGPILSGRVSQFLGFYHNQVCLMPEPSAVAGFLRWMWRFASGPQPLLPTEAFEAVLPQNILPVPLMRALAVGDDEAAERLGATQLLEEDVALLSYLCPSGADYGTLLRQSLDRIAGGAA